MPSEEKDTNESSEGDKSRQQDTTKRHFSGYWTFDNTKEWVRMYLVERMTVGVIATVVGADESTVSKWLKRHEVEVYQGKRRKERDPPNISTELAELLRNGAEAVLKILDERVWGVNASESGLKQLDKFCDFVKLPLDVGLTAAAKAVDTDKSMITAWTRATRQPYLVRVADAALHIDPRRGGNCFRSGSNPAGTCKARGYKFRQ